MQYRCHATEKSGEECVKNILFVHYLSTKKYKLSYSIELKWFATITIPMHFI